MSHSRTPMSARNASIAGSLFVVLGAWLVFVGTGRPHIAPAQDVPLWMVGLAGIMFACAGGAMFVRYRYLGASPSDPASGMGGSPLAQSIQLALASGTVAAMGGMCAWVAFGPGPRHFRSRSTLPFMGLTSERTGRIGFGIAAVLLAVVLMIRIVVGLRTVFGAMSRAR